MELDAITFEVMRHALESIAEEMGLALIRTALSPNIKDRRDCSAAIYTPTGDLVAQAEHIPLHLGVMPSVVRAVLGEYPPERLAPGDAVIMNDPYRGGSHIPDVTIVAPVHAGGSLVAFVAATAHHVDLGGMVPGSMPVHAREIFQEGLRLPPLCIRTRGQVVEDLVRLLAANVRTPEELRGDLLAQLAACNTGARRVAELCERYGPSLVGTAMRDLIAYGRRRMEAALESFPEGAFEFEDYVEGDGTTTDELLPIRVRVMRSGASLLVDFEGTSPQTAGSVNCPMAVTRASVYYAVKSVLDPEAPSNLGTFSPIVVTAPEGSLVNPRFPAAVSNANINTAQRIVDTVLGALAQALPDAIPAASSGTMNLLVLGGIDPRTGEYYSYVETYGGGQGASALGDGADGIHSHMTNTRNTPAEVIEHSYPLRVERYELVPDSGGAGRYRGGCGILREITVLGHQAQATVSTDRHLLRPWGRAGGHPGAPARCWIIHPDGTHAVLPSKTNLTLNPGTRIVLATAGGGGYGDPAGRERHQIQRDMDEGLVSWAEAGGHFVCSPGEAGDRP